MDAHSPVFFLAELFPPNLGKCNGNSGKVTKHVIFCLMYKMGHICHLTQLDFFLSEGAEVNFFQ